MRFKTLNWKRDLAPSLAAIIAVICASVFALSRKSEAGHEVRQTSKLTANLLARAQLASATLLSPEEFGRMEAVRQDYVSRIRDSEEAGRVVPELTESARRAGLIVREIQPVQPASVSAGATVPRRGTPYRVMAYGGFRQIAEYMELCKRQRVPARVAEMRVTACDPADRSARAGDLAAELTMEIFDASLAGDSESGEGDVVP